MNEWVFCIKLPELKELRWDQCWEGYFKYVLGYVYKIHFPKL